MAGQGLQAGEVDLTAAARQLVEEHHAAPCAVVGGALWQPGRGWRHGWGASGQLWSSPPAGQMQTAPPVGLDAVFDLASLTKPMTALTLARLERLGLANRQQTVGALLPELASSAAAAATLDLLSAHRAGLEAHREMFVQRPGAQQPARAAVLRQAAAGMRGDCLGTAPEHGFAPVYSDLGYILLGAALEAACGRALDELVSEQVGRPLAVDMGSLRQLLPQVGIGRVVPTECVDWRGGVIRGQIHDENAWVLAGRGTAGHAGQFADVASVVRVGTAIVDAWVGRDASWLSAAELEPLLRIRPGGTHRAGFDSRAPEGPSMSGSYFGDDTFGHLGFTGTSIWIDPELQLVGVLLSNRVHPSRDADAIRRARPAAYDVLYQAMVGAAA